MMRKIWISAWVLAPLLCAQSAQTTTTFYERDPKGMDAYGNQLFDQTVTISTDNYEVDTFWSRFYNPENKAKNFAQVATTANARLIVEASSACSIAGKGILPAEGCSGQKPFLINNEALAGVDEGETIQLIFQPAIDDATGNTRYDSADASVFYPLDIDRDGAFYQESATAQPGKRTFFSFFTGIFDFFFSRTIGFGADFFGKPKIADIRYDTRSPEAEDRRQRYIANIAAGLDQNHRLKKLYEGVPGTSLEAPKVNDPASLLHYAEAKKATEAEQCKFMFLNLSSDGLMCRIMSGFGMDAWMPFFNKAQISELEVNTITIDTENTLLSLAGQVTNTPYQKVVTGTENESLSFLKEMLKPMSAMMEMMKNMMFGSSKSTIVADPVEMAYAFDDAEAMTLGFAVTNDGSRVDDFAHFKLTGIRSTYGDEISTCKVKYGGSFMGFGSWTETFYGYKGSETTSRTKGSIDTHAEWIDWCQEQTGGKGVFDALFDWSSGGIFNPMNWMKSMWNMMSWFFGGSYEITEFKSTLKRGLILDLKKETINPVSPMNTTKIKLINVTH